MSIYGTLCLTLTGSNQAIATVQEDLKPQEGQKMAFCPFKLAGLPASERTPFVASEMRVRGDREIHMILWDCVGLMASYLLDQVAERYPGLDITASYTQDVEPAILVVGRWSEGKRILKTMFSDDFVLQPDNRSEFYRLYAKDEVKDAFVRMCPVNQEQLEITGHETALDGWIRDCGYDNFACVKMEAGQLKEAVFKQKENGWVRLSEIDQYGGYGRIENLVDSDLPTAITSIAPVWVVLEASESESYEEFI